MKSAIMTPRVSLRFVHNRDDLLYKQLPLILKLALLLAIFNSLSQVGWGLLIPFFSPPPTEQASGTVPAPANTPSSADSSPRQINFNLFGTPPVAPVAPPPPPPPPPAPAPITPLNATLRGIIFFATAPERAMAIILDNNVNREEGYRSGDWLPDQAAQIKEVHADHVIVEHNGQRETLRLPRDAGMGELLLSTDAQAGSPSPPKVITMAPPPPPLPPVTVVNAPPKAAQNLTDLRNLLLDNPEEAMSLAKFEFMYEEGAFLGVRLFSNKDPTVFEPFGIQSGDIVTHINGTKLTGDPSQMAEFYSQASTMKMVTVRILRYGRDGRLPMMFNFPFAQ